jgi:Holliday junction resolvase
MLPSLPPDGCPSAVAPAEAEGSLRPAAGNPGISPRSRKAKGRRNEARSAAWLEARGYRVVRAAGSKGVWDLWGCRPQSPQLLLVQVKTGRMPPAVEIERMVKFPIGSEAQRLLHLWMPMEREPLVWEVVGQDPKAIGLVLWKEADGT